MSGEHLTIPELAERLHVSVRTVKDMNYRGTGPRYFRTGTQNGRALYPLAWVEEWERAHEVEREPVGRAR